MKWDSGMALIWKFNDIIAFLFMFPYFNEVNCLSEKRMMRTDDSYCSKI